jgi:DNA-directed RNA polymerase specialized sigma24 family protein
MEGPRKRFASRLRPLRGLSDEELTAAVAAGDKRAFGFIFERYHEALYRFCAGMLGDADRAVDALQGTMLAAMRGLKAADPQIPLRPWLYRIAYRESVALLDEDVAAPEEGLARQLHDLPVQLRAALLLHELGGLEHGEVAAALGISAAAVRRSVREAREAIEPPGGVRSSARQAQRVVELGALFALPPAVADAVSAAGSASLGSEANGDRPRHRLLVAFLVLAVAVGSVAALAALGTFDPGGGGGNGPSSRAAEPTPVQVAPPGGSGAPPAHAGGAPAGGGGAAGAPGGARAATATAGPGPGTATAATRSGGAPVGEGAVSAVSAASGYSTSGERVQGALGR